MRFIKTENLKTGMRLAKPIYNKDGVLLYERDSTLAPSSINSIRNFGLIGIYILEPAEPVPPLTEEDLEFEQLQTVYMFKLQDCMDRIQRRQKLDNLYPFLQDLLRHYGTLDHRVNFNQNLRSGEDFMYKHAISTGILVALMTSRLQFSLRKQMTMVTAALLYDYGYRYVPKNVLEKGPSMTDEDREVVQQSLERGLDRLSMYSGSHDFFPRAVALMQSYIYSTNPGKLTSAPDADLTVMTDILRVAIQFDQMTAMNVGYEPISEIMAMRRLQEAPNLYHPNNVATLAECIHIVPAAASVDLSSGDKGIVLVENKKNFMRPIILRLSDNKIYDLSRDDVFRELQVSDIMKTMDNRVQMDEETIKQFVPDEELKKMTARFRDDLMRAREREQRMAEAAETPDVASFEARA